MRAAFIFFILTGCTSMPIGIKPVQSVDRAVGISCLDQSKTPDRPEIHTEDEVKKMPDSTATLVLISEHLGMRVYIEKLEAWISPCK